MPFYGGDNRVVTRALLLTTSTYTIEHGLSKIPVLVHAVTEEGGLADVYWETIDEDTIVVNTQALFSGTLYIST
tara:strand:- start:394 stop:615 length:222 start_codon:yes stop_codon:yes gene_type:complete